ncbi:DUF4352 domain-containing protein [Enterococcus sp. ZJ1668]|uniref:DUF4352 domain-containing protein n=1 Tax=Enterococcus sp. ZJ1668 TaxID=2709402 RepID=UPI0013EAE1C7|nr:DUF4352 domain-containing protein [Enterococcus sp. ZJ1668]
MKKIAMLISSLALLVGLAACTKPSQSETDKKTAQTEVSQATSTETAESLVADGLRISVSKPSVDKSNNGEQKQTIYTFQVIGENISSDTKGLGSIDFVLVTTDGQKVNIDPEMESFGDEIPAEKKLEGPVAFVLTEDQKPAQLLYQIDGETLAQWDVN